MPELPKRGLGKGLNALIRTPSSTPANVPVPPPSETPQPALVEGDKVMKVSLTQVVPSPLQPRKRFNEEHLEELASSIREHGLIQPLIVRVVDGKYELIAGERRFRACSKLGLSEVPVVTKDATDKDVLEMALIENLQREDLDPIEEAQAYRELTVKFGLKQEEIAKQVGKSRSDVSNTMRLLDLDRAVQQLVSQKHISRGHAKALLGIKNRSEQAMLADMIVRKKLTVRDTESMVQEHLHGKSSTKPKDNSDVGLPDKDDTYLKFVEDKLRGRYSTNVIINHKEKKGKIEIEYYGNEDLSRVLELMGVNLD